MAAPMSIPISSSSKVGWGFFCGFFVCRVRSVQLGVGVDFAFFFCFTGNSHWSRECDVCTLQGTYIVVANKNHLRRSSGNINFKFCLVSKSIYALETDLCNTLLIRQQPFLTTQKDWEVLAESLRNFPQSYMKSTGVKFLPPFKESYADFHFWSTLDTVTGICLDVLPLMI